MKIINKIIITAILPLLALGGCENNKRGAGTLMGAAVGGLAGAAFGKGDGQLLAIGLGAALGAAAGNHIGGQLDEQDKAMMATKSQQAFEYVPSGKSMAWNNPDSGHSGYITPIKTVKEEGRYCREYTNIVKVGGEEQKAYGKACRQPDGSWEIVQ